MTTIELKIKKVHPDAIIPQYQSEGAACLDLHAIDMPEPVALSPGSSFVCRTGLSVEVPPGHVMLIYSRSGHGFKDGVRLANTVGVIDADYRGEVMVKLYRDTQVFSSPFIVSNGDRIAQAMLVPLPRVQVQVVEELSQTKRGAGGFGSTGG